MFFCLWKSRFFFQLNRIYFYYSVCCSDLNWVRSRDLLQRLFFEAPIEQPSDAVSFHSCPHCKLDKLLEINQKWAILNDKGEKSNWLSDKYSKVCKTQFLSFNMYKSWIFCFMFYNSMCFGRASNQSRQKRTHKAHNLCWNGLTHKTHILGWNGYFCHQFIINWNSAGFLFLVVITFGSFLDETSIFFPGSFWKTWLL